MPTITRRLEFDAGHRVWGHESKCAHLHGHRYVVHIQVWAPNLDGIGRVVDFSVIKEKVGGWIDAHWDHNFLCHPDDPITLLEMYPQVCLRHSEPPVRIGAILTDKPFYRMLKGNPTAENMAEELYHKACDLLPSPLRVTCVRVFETPNCWADYPSPLQDN